MTDALLNAALAGTSRAGGQLPAPATPADALVPPASELGAERQLLLAAGARATYRRAGLETRGIAAPTAAQDDPAPFCSPGAARLLGRMLTGEHNELLPEAFDRLNRAGRRLPHALLPAALEAGARRAELRPALLVAIGERGRWLAGHNQPWRWATARPVASDGALPPDAAVLWEEGPPAQRLAILRQVRAHDSAQGRAWVATTWKDEKAEFRAEALQSLETGLSPDDEAFLEAALDDRSPAVRPAAAKLLARLPDSAFAVRMRERADRFLSFSPGLRAGGWRAAAKALVTGASGGKLVVAPPEVYDKAWTRDGIPEKPPGGIGARARWLELILALIPPSHWSTRLATEPATLIAAVEGSDWAEPTLIGWSEAASVHGDAGWAAALWQHWSTAKFDRQELYEVGRRMGSLAHCLPQSQAERLVIDVLTRRSIPDDRLVFTMQLLPRPWSAGFTSAILRQVRERVQELSAQGNVAAYGETWLVRLTTSGIAFAIPPAAFDEALALQTLEINEEQSTTTGWWHRRIAEFADIVRTRQQLMKEIPL